MIGDAFEYMSHHPVPGVLCEFGVWQGGGLESIKLCSEEYLGGGIPIFGFDTFEGMPVTSVQLKDHCAEVWRPGGYADTSRALVEARVPGVALIKGEFGTLGPLLDYGIMQVRFARIDCDIYEGYRDALRLLTPAIQKGTILLFDEGVAPDDERYHAGVRDSGERAIREWEQTSGVHLRTLQEKWTERLGVVE